MSVYATETLKFTIGQVTLIFAIVQAVAVPATWSIGWFARRIPEVPLVIGTCTGWLVLTLLFALRPSCSGMLAASLFWVDCVVGSTPALLRAIMGMIVHPDQRAELFGFASLAGRFRHGAWASTIYLISFLRAIGPRGALIERRAGLSDWYLTLVFVAISRKRVPTNRERVATVTGP